MSAEKDLVDVRILRLADCESHRSRERLAMASCVCRINYSCRSVPELWTRPQGPTDDELREWAWIEGSRDPASQPEALGGPRDSIALCRRTRYALGRAKTQP